MLFFLDQRRRRIAELRVNDYIKAKEVRVVAPDGSQIGVKEIGEAMWLADQLGLDLVEVAPGANPPVCRLMDYGKFKYEQSVRDREARKKQSRTVIKELRMRPRIGEHDYQILKGRAIDFLHGGDKVKVTLRFRGREASRPEYGRKVLDRLSTDLGDITVMEQNPRLEGRNMNMVLAPDNRAIKAAAKAARAELAAAEDSETHALVADPELENSRENSELVEASAPEVESELATLEEVAVGEGTELAESISETEPTE